MPNPKLPGLTLSDDEAQTLRDWVRRRKTVQALALRSRIVLRCAEGGSNSEIAAELGIGRAGCEMAFPVRGRATISNTGRTVAAMVRLSLRERNGTDRVPTLYSDNYFWLLPGESRTGKINPQRSVRQPRLFDGGVRLRPEADLTQA